MRRAVKDDKPFFIWHNTTRTHSFTHLRPEYEAMVPDIGFMGAAMTEFDNGIGVLLNELEKLGIDDNTIVIISSDNGAMQFAWPDGGTTPFRSEKATTWEGGFRVPCVVKWPGVIEPGTTVNDIFHHMDWIPTFMAALGEDDIVGKLKKGYKANDKTFKVHLDGYNQLPLLKGEGPGSRTEIHYISDDGDYCAFRYNKWKISFLTQSATGIDVWDKAYTVHRFPIIADLRADPFERAYGRTDAAGMTSASFNYDNWHFRRGYLLVPAQVYVGKFLESFKEFPPRSKPASFSVGDALSHLESASQGK
jgi:arylsulfatase